PGASAAATATAKATTATADVHATDVALAHRSAPGGLHFTAVERAQEADVVHDVGIGRARDRAVLVVDRGGTPAGAATIVVAPLLRDLGEVHRLGVDELHLLDGVVCAGREAGEQQVGERTGLARGVVLVVAEGGVLHEMQEVVVLVAADREVRHIRLRQAAAVFLLRIGPRVAGVLGFTDEQRVDDLRGVGAATRL